MIDKKSSGISKVFLKKGIKALAGLIILTSLGCTVAVHETSLSTLPYDRPSQNFKTYFLKQKIWTLGDHFNILDDQGNTCFVVRGNVFSLGDRLRLYDLNGNELAFIKQKLLSLRKQYRIFRDQRLWARMLKKITLFKDTYTLDLAGSDEYLIKGDFTNHLYAFIRKGKAVAFISKAWFSWGDSYRIRIDPNEDDVLILTAAIIIDMASHDDEHHHGQT